MSPGRGWFVGPGEASPVWCLLKRLMPVSWPVYFSSQPISITRIKQCWQPLTRRDWCIRCKICFKCPEMLPMVWPVRPRAGKAYFFAFSRLHSQTFRIWYPYWSLIAMATSDFPCSLDPVLSLPNQNETFVKIPSGSTYSARYDELTLHRGENDSETPPSYPSLSAVKKWGKTAGI